MVEWPHYGVGMHPGYWVSLATARSWGMIVVLMVVGVGLVASVFFSDQLQEALAGLYGLLD
jgi:cytochrome c oxidase subunit IV